MSASDNRINNYRGRASGRGGISRGRGRSNNSRPIRQVCGKVGHTALICYYRYNQSYMGSVPADQHKNNSNTVAANTTNPYATYATAAPNDVADQGWYFDSGSTHHITNNLNNLNQATNYFGKSQLEVANG